MLATEKNAAARSCKLQAIWFERDFSKSEGAIEAGAGSQGQILARGCSPQKTAAAAAATTTRSQVQAKKAEYIPERGFHEAVAEGGRSWRWGWGNKGKEGTAPEGLGTKKRVTGDSSQRVSVALEKAKQLVSPETEWEGKKKAAYSYQEEEEVGDVLLPVERTMIEDKAGWGLVPGLQAPLLHIHTTAGRRSVGSSYYCWAGLGGLELACTDQLGDRRKATLLWPASEPR